MRSRGNRTFPRPTQGRNKDHRKRWTPAAASRSRRIGSDRPQWKPTTARAERLKPPRWTPGRASKPPTRERPQWTPMRRVQPLKLPRWTPAKSIPQPYHDPAVRKIARHNHLIEPRIIYGVAPQRPGRGWLYELYASQGRLAEYFRLFPNG